MLDTASQLMQVAMAFRAYGQGTATEVIYAAELDKDMTVGRNYGLRSTISTLETMGLLRNVGKRQCEVTGRLARVLAWNPAGDDATVRPVYVELTEDDMVTLASDPQRVAMRIIEDAKRQRATQARTRARREEIVAVLEAA